MVGVAGVAYSPDGSRVVSAGRDGKVKLWRTDTGELIWTLAAHAAFVDEQGIEVPGVWIEDIAYSADGLVATAAPDNNPDSPSVKIIDAMTGREVRALPTSLADGSVHEASSVAFTPDGDNLVTGGFIDGVVRIWEVSTGSLLGSFSVGAGIDHVTVSPDGTRIAVGDTDSRATIWDRTSLTRVMTLAGHTGRVWAVAFSPDGERLATGSGDATVRIWDLDSGTTDLVLRGHAFEVKSLAISPDGSRLVSMSPLPGATIRMWALDLDDLIRMAHEENTRSFTAEECRQYLHLEACPDRRVS